MSALRSMDNPIPTSFYTRRVTERLGSLPAPQRKAVERVMRDKAHVVEAAARMVADEDHEAIVSALEQVLRDNGIPV